MPCAKQGCCDACLQDMAESSHIAAAACHALRYLRADIANLQADYTALMYGGVSSTQKGFKFDKPSPANAFSSGVFSNLYYRWELAAVSHAYLLHWLSCLWQCQLPARAGLAPMASAWPCLVMSPQI
jgi:hypothetical protein